MDRSRIKSKISSLRQNKGLERGKKKEEKKYKATKKILKRHGGKSLPREMKLLSTTDGFWSSAQEFRSSRSSGSNVTPGKYSDTIKSKKSQLSSPKDCQKTASPVTEKRTPKHVKETGKEANSSQKASKCTAELKRLETTDGFWSPGLTETTLMSVSEPSKVAEKEKESTASKSYTPSIMSELRRLQTTDGFWSPSFKNPSPSSRDASPSSTNSSLDRLARRSFVKQGEKKKEEDSNTGNNNSSLKRTRSSSLVTEKLKSTPTLKLSDKETSPGSNEPFPKRAKRSVMKAKEEPVVLRKSRTSLGSPNSHDSPSNVKKLVSKSKNASPSFPTRTDTSQKTSSSNISVELRRLNTTDGFWSPLPKISSVLGAREQRPVRKTSVQSQSQLLEHRKKKLKSLKLTARNINHSVPGIRGRPACRGQNPTKLPEIVTANQDATHPPASDKQKRTKTFMFGVRRKRFRHTKITMKREQPELPEANSSSVTALECEADKAVKGASKGDNVSVVATKETKTWRKGRQTSIQKRDKTRVKKSIGRHVSKENPVSQSVEVSMECEEKVDSCQPETHKSSSNISSLRSEHSDVEKNESGGGDYEFRGTRKRGAQLMGNKGSAARGRGRPKLPGKRGRPKLPGKRGRPKLPSRRGRPKLPSRRGSAMPARRGVARGQGSVSLVRRGSRRLESAEPSGRGRRGTRGLRSRGSNRLGTELSKKSSREMSPETDHKGSARSRGNSKLVSGGLRDQVGQNMKSPVHGTSEENHSNIFDIMQGATQTIRDTQTGKAFNDTSDFSLSLIPNADKVLPDIKSDLTYGANIKCEQNEKGLNLDKKVDVMAPKALMAINGVDTKTDIKETNVSMDNGKDETVPCAELDVSGQEFESETSMELDSHGDDKISSDKDVTEQTDDGQVLKILSVELKTTEIQAEVVNCAGDALNEGEQHLTKNDSRSKLEVTLPEEITDGDKTLLSGKEKFGGIEYNCGREAANAVFDLKSVHDDAGHQVEVQIHETSVEKENDDSNDHSVSSLPTEQISVDVSESICADHENSTVSDGVAIKDTETGHQVFDEKSPDDATACSITKDAAVEHSQSEMRCHERPCAQIHQNDGIESVAAPSENQLLESKTSGDHSEVLSDQVVENLIDTVEQTEKEEHSKEVEVASQDGLKPMSPSTISPTDQDLHMLDSSNTKVDDAQNLTADQSKGERSVEESDKKMIDESVLCGITTHEEEYSSKSQMTEEVLAVQDDYPSAKKTGKGAVHKNYLMRSRQDSLSKHDFVPLEPNSVTMAISEKVGMQDSSSSQPNPLRRVRKRRYNSWSRGVLKKAKRISTQNKVQQSNNSLSRSDTIPMTSSSRSTRVTKLPSMPQSDTVAELAEQASKILEVSSDSDKPKKLLKALKRLKTDANLANASIDAKTLQTRAHKGLLPITRRGPASRQKLVASESTVSHPESTRELRLDAELPLPDDLTDLQSFRDEIPKLEKTCLPKLSPLSLVTTRPEDQSFVAAGPPVLTPQQPIDFFIPSNVDAKPATSGEDEVVNESVDDTDFHLYLSGASDDEGTTDLENQTTTDIFSGTSKTNQGKSVQVSVLSEETKAGSGSSGPAFIPESKSPTTATSTSRKSKMRGKRGRPPGIRVSQRDVLIQQPKSVHKSIPSIHIPPRPMRTFEFRKKTTRSPLQMLEMKRKQEEAIYDLEMERIQARKIIRREKRIARTPVDDLAEQEIAAYFNLRPCSVVLSDFVKKLNLNESLSDLYHDNIPSSSYSPEYEDDLEDEDWCADLQDVEDEFEDECVEQTKNMKRPHIPRLKLKRVSKKGKPTLIVSKARNLVSQLKSPEQEPLKLVIKTEAFSDAEDQPRNLPSEPQGSTVFENNYVEFLKQRSLIAKAPDSKSSSLQEASRLSSNSRDLKDRTSVALGSQGLTSKDDSFRTSDLTPAKPSTSRSLSDTPVCSQSQEKGHQAVVSSSKNACPQLAPQNVINTDTPKSTCRAVPEGLELGTEEEEDMLIVDLTSPDSKQEDIPLMDGAAVLSPKDQISSISQCPDGHSEIKASNATSSMSISAFSTLSNECKSMSKSESAPVGKGTCNSSDNVSEDVMGNQNKQLNSVESESDLDAIGTTKVDLPKAGSEGVLLATDSGSTDAALVNKVTDEKRANAVNEAATPSELKESVEANSIGWSLEIRKNSNTDSLQEDGATQSRVHDIQQTNEEFADKLLGSVEKPDAESEKDTVTKVTSLEMNRDFPLNQENVDILPPSNNNNNNVVKPCKTSKSVDSSSPVHSTSEEPKGESRKLKSIPSSFKQMSGSYKCNRCSFTAVSKLSIESHIYSHIPGVHFQCIKCQSEFSSMNAINTHFINSHPNTESEFYISRNVVESNFYTISTEQEETVTSQIATGTGGQSPPLIISLVVSGGTRSVRSSSASRRFVCTHCGFSTNVKEDVQQHVSDLHAAQSLFACTLCNDSVGLSESEIKEHSASVHPSRQRPYVKLPDFYDADQLAMVETSGNSEERGANVLRVSTLFPGDESPREQTSVGHQMKAKDYLYLQEGWKGKTSAEADSTTATDYSDENLVDATSKNEATKDFSKEGSCSSETKLSSSDDKGPSEEDLPSVPQAEDGDVSNLKIVEVVSLSGTPHVPEDDPTTNVIVPSPQTTSCKETDGNFENLSESSKAEVFLSSHMMTSPSTLAGLNSSISDSPVAHSVPNISVVATSHSHSPVSSLMATDTTPSPPMTESQGMDHCNPPVTSKNSLPMTTETESDAEDKMEGCASSPLVSTITTSSFALSTSTTSISSSEEVTQAATSDKSVASPPSGIMSNASSQAKTPDDTPISEDDQAPGSCEENSNYSNTSTDVSEKDAPASQSSSSSSSSSVTGGLPLSYQCKSCKVHTPYLLMMVRHLKSRHPKILCFSCPYCKSGQSFNTQKQLRHHVRSMHPDKVDKNEMSLSDEAKKFVEAMVLPKSPQCTRVGNRLILEEDIHTCTVCSLRMTSLSSVYDHLNEKHSDLFEFVCPSCQSFKNKSLQVVSDHCIAVHQSELDKDKVHVSVPKYLFTILSCISKQAKYIEKNLTSSSSTAPSKDSSNSSASGETTCPDKDERQVSDPQPVKSQTLPNKGSHPNQTGHMGAVMESPNPAPARYIPPTTSMQTGVALDMLTKQVPIVAIPVMAQTSMAATTRSVVAISSSLFDTSSLSLPKSSSTAPSPVPILPLGMSPGMVPQQRAGKSSFSLPVLNVPTIRPRSASVMQQPVRPPSGESPNLHASTMPRNDSTTPQASVDQVPEDEPNPDAFKIFNLRPTGMTPPVVAAPVSVAQAAPSVFPPCSSSAALPSGFIPGPIAGFPAAMVIPPALLHSAFPFAAASIANPVHVVADNGKGQGKFPVQNIRPMTPIIAGQLPQPHLQNIAQAKQLLYQQQQKQRQQLASQNTPSNATVQSHGVGRSPRHPQNPFHPQLANAVIMGQQQRAATSFPVTIGPVLSSIPLSSSQFMSPQPGPSSVSTPSISSNPSKKGRKSAALYRCPYCASGPPLKALDVASHIRHAHPGRQVIFQKTT